MSYWLRPSVRYPGRKQDGSFVFASLTLRTEVQRLRRFSEEVQRTALVEGKPRRAVASRRAGPGYYPRTTNDLTTNLFGSSLDPCQKCNLYGLSKGSLAMRRTERGNGSRRRATAANAETKRCGWIAVAGFSVESGDNEPLRFRVPREARC